MTDEQLQILKKELAARLPYDTYISYDYEDGIDRAYKLHGNHYYLMQLGKMKWENCKPYLRPIISMTDEEKEEINKLFEHESTFLTPYNPSWYVSENNIQSVVDFYLSHHLDWRGLITMGLALPATNEMYNIE